MSAPSGSAYDQFKAHPTVKNIQNQSSYYINQLDKEVSSSASSSSSKNLLIAANTALAVSDAQQP